MTRRALVLAGGGIRVAWQTGVVMALDEAGIEFEHGDGTSGGIFTLAMLQSGLTPTEMAERWRAVTVRRFVSLLPLWEYLRSPTDWSAIGGSGGIRRHILPQLGIDIARVNSATAMTGSFNVADFGAKQCVAIPHTELDEDLLIAGVSLAGLMPAVQRDGKTWTDAVWIKDANLTDSVQRGCTELWVAWCIGNTPRWGNGSLEQYVHMIEMSATAGLENELGWVASTNAARAQGDSAPDGSDRIRVHVIRPSLPLPLDPDFVAGRIDAETLIDIGYRDACAYLAQRTDDGVDITTPEARHALTATPARALGARITLRANGYLNPGGDGACTLVVESDSLDDLAGESRASGVGGFRHPKYGYRPFRSASVRLVGSAGERHLSATAMLTLGGDEHRLDIRIPMSTVKWSAAREQHWTLTDAAGVTVATGLGRMSPLQTLRAITSFEPMGAHNLADRLNAIRRMRRIVSYGGPKPSAQESTGRSGG